MEAKDVLHRIVGKNDSRVSYPIHIYARLDVLEIIKLRTGARIVATAQSHFLICFLLLLLPLVTLIMTRVELSITRCSVQS
jgi:hypothetical protein